VADDIVTAEVTLTGGGDRDPFGGDRPWSHNAWTVELTYQGRTMETPYYTGDAIGEPTVREILECLLMDASGVKNARTFEDWCGDYGFDVDSRRAEATYRAAVEQTEKLRALLGDDFDAAVFPGSHDHEWSARRLAPIS
jgi:hypothetical protein